MGDYRQQVAVGAFVLFAGILVIVTALFFGQFHLFEQIRQASVVFDGSVSGLVVGAPVTFRGVRVGSVSSATILYDDRTHAALISVKLKIEHGKVVLTHAEDGNDLTVQKLVAEGLHAELNTVSFVTGQAEIDLDFAPGAPSVFHPGITDLPEIPTMVSPTAHVLDEFSKLPLDDLARNADQLMVSLRSLSDSLGAKVPGLVDGLSHTNGEADVALEAATDAINDLHTRVGTTLAGIDRLASTGDKQLDQRGAELHTLLVSANQAINDAHDVLANLKTMTNDRSAARLNLESSLNDLATAAAALRGFANDVEHNPQLLLTGRRQ